MQADAAAMAAASYAFSDSYAQPYADLPCYQSPMQPPPPPPIDPALALYPPYYYHHQPVQNLPLPPYSSPSSAGSDELGTPPTEHLYPAFNNKRPPSVVDSDPRKKSRKDNDDEPVDDPKPKPTRGSRCVPCHLA